MHFFQGVSIVRIGGQDDNCRGSVWIIFHTLVYRVWKNRVKGRDWYDFEWYVRHDVPLDFAHLAERCKQFNNEDITPELFKEKLIERLSTADIKQVKEDVLPFVRNPKELDIWSNDYFVQLAGMMRMR